MRNLFTLAICALLMQGIAWAADGQKAELTTTVTFSEEMMAMLGALGDMGGEADSPDEAMPPMVMNQRMFWSDSGMRMEILSEIGVDMTVIYDYTNSVMYQFNSAEKVATKMMLDQTPGMGEMGMMGSDPMDMFLNWKEALAGMREQPHMIVNDFPEKDINGYPCKGIGFTMDMEALMAERAEDEAGMGMAMGMLGGMGDVGGEIWFREGLGFPVLYEFTSMGTMVSMALNNLEDWTVDVAMLSVPAGYEIEELEMPDFGDMELPEG